MKLLPILAPLIFRHRPAEITLFATSLCNFRCRHCFIIDKLNQKHDELSCDEIKKIGHSIVGLQRVHIGGGEPFLRPDIGDIVTTIANDWNTETICLPTNGWESDNIIKTIKRFGNSSSKTLRLHFSLNTLPQDMDDFTGKKGAFDRWIASITQAKVAAEPFKNITIMVIATYNDFNQAYFPRLMDYILNEIGVMDFSFCLVRAHKLYTPDLDLNQFDNLVKFYFRERSNQSFLLRAFREIVRETIASYYKKPRMIAPCLSGKMRIVISPDGNIYPCETFGYPSGDDPQKWLIGNVREYDYDLSRMLASACAKKIRQNIRASRCHCQQGIDLSLNLLCSHRFKFLILGRALRNIFHN
jgi:radical SAM protein with 4Fe4S-binding SPASM domain